MSELSIIDQWHKNTGAAKGNCVGYSEEEWVELEQIIDLMRTEALGLAKQLKVEIEYRLGRETEYTLQASPVYQAAQRFIEEYGHE